MLELRITFKTETKRTEKINYLHVEDGKIFFTIADNPIPVFQRPIDISLEYIDTLEVTNI